MTRTSCLLLVTCLWVTACGGGGGGGPSESILLSGKADLLNGFGGQVQATAGSRTVTAPVGTDGTFTVNVNRVSRGSFVALRVRGAAGARNDVELESLLGSVEQLKAQAGSDNTLSVAESRKLSLDNFQTANSVLVRRLGFLPRSVVVPGRVIALSDEQLATAEGAVDPSQALLLASALELVATDQAIDFPAGFETSLELALDETASATYVETQLTQNSTALQAALDSLTTTLGSTAGFTTATVPSLAHFATTSSTLAGDAEEFTFTAGGSGLYRGLWDGAPTADNEDTTTWAVVNGAIEVTLTNGLVAPFSFFEDDGSGGQIEVTGNSVLESISLRPLEQSAAGTTALAVFRGRDDFTSPPRPSEPFEFTHQGQLVGAAGFIPYTTAAVAGLTHALEIYDADHQRGGGGGITEMNSDLLQFNSNGTGTAQLSGQTFTWSVANGELNVSLSTGAQGTYRRLFALGENEQFRVAALLRSAQGNFFPTAVTSTVVQPGAPAQTAGDYHQNGIGTEGFVDLIDEFVIRLSTDTTAFQISLTANSASGEVIRDERPLRPWRIDSTTGELVLERTYDQGVDETNNCDPSVNAMCFVFDQRRALVLSTSGDRQFWLEKRRRPCDVGSPECAPGGVVENAPADFLLRFYDVRPAGSF